MSCKVFLADDSEVVRRAIRMRLSAHADIEIVGETETFAETIRLVPILKPRIIVLDIHLKDFEAVKPHDFCDASRIPLRHNRHFDFLGRRD